ncbi:MAG: uroporphyrinogen-III C-methyltransferase, partial [Candidatus Bathyarchaeia archaeon]
LVENGIKFEVVPGVTSAIAAPAYAGIPLTHRNYAASVTVVTGHRAEKAEKFIDWAKIATTADTIVILMGIESLGDIVAKLVNGGLDPQVSAAIIEQGTTKQQRVLINELGSIVEEAKAKKIQPPAVIVIGEVVKLGRKLAWFRKP